MAARRLILQVWLSAPLIPGLERQGVCFDCQCVAALSAHGSQPASDRGASLSLKGKPGVTPVLVQARTLCWGGGMLMCVVDSLLCSGDLPIPLVPQQGPPVPGQE